MSGSESGATLSGMEEKGTCWVRLYPGGFGVWTGATMVVASLALCLLTEEKVLVGREEEMACCLCCLAGTWSAGWGGSGLKLSKRSW